MDQEKHSMVGFNSRFSTMAWALLGLVLIGYGFVAFNAGSKISPLMNSANQADETVTYIMAQADQGISMSHSEEVAVLPFWINLIAKIESSQYIHGSDSIMETERHFYRISEQKKQVLSTHMMLGLVIMAAGFFQFWPAFRRKHRKIHRALGVLYVGTAFTSMGMSGYYLVNNGIEDTYSQFVFFTGLWFLLALSVISISIAGIAIFKRNIALHLGWQALAFGCFLSAPVQRALWVGLAPFSNGATFNEVNIAVNVCLLALCLLGGYLLFYLNRESSPQRASSRSAKPKAVALPGQYSIYIAFFLAWVLVASFYLGASGFSGTALGQRFVPAVASQWHDSVISSLMPWVLVMGLAVFLVAAARVLSHSSESLGQASAEMKAILLSGAVVSVVFITWGWQLGMPSHAHSVAGAFYMIAATLILLFLSLIAYGINSDQPGKVREWLWFAVLFMISPALMYLSLFIMNVTNIVPVRYVQLGHGYQIAAALALALPVIIGHLMAVYSPLTQRYAVN